ncbi:MAG: endonuclease V [Pseudomonadota bacterium]
MILAVDVYYGEKAASCGGVSFKDWKGSSPEATYLHKLDHVAEYKPGEFYKRELPCIIELLNTLTFSPETVIIDGYVFLDGCAKPGLGKHLYDALDRSTPVIGVAKSRYKSIRSEFALLRGKSMRPLFVTTSGMDIDDAKCRVKEMHGEFRIPTLLRAADQLARSNLD